MIYSSMECKIFLFGASGKMGSCFGALVSQTPPFSLTSDPARADAFVDFSVASALEDHLALALRHKQPLVIGTTGHAEGLLERLQTASFEIPLFLSYNFSLGAALFIETLSRFKRHFPKNTMIAIEECHHLSKRDAPSGTALKLAQALDFPPEKIRSERKEEIVGIHEVRLTSGGESILFRHEAASREVFAQGALSALRFILKKTPGLYTMEDLIHAKS